jgi:hypothetical protein
LQLGEDANPFTEMRVSMQEVSLEQVPVGILRAGAEIELTEVFITDPRLPAERQIPVPPVWLAERNVL